MPQDVRTAHVLVVEDNADLALGLRMNLEVEGHRVTVAATGADGLRLARELRPDLLVLDLMLPDLDGYRVLETLRDEGHELPVLILTARQEERDKVRGFRLGADDYVTKPFGLDELLARVGALLRRARPAAGPEVVRFGDVELLPKQHLVRRDGRTVELRPMELELLLALAARRNETVARGELLAQVWGYREGVMSRTIDTHMAELRRKLEADPSQPRHLLSVRKVGYQLRT
jgi:DNA-binding response OmpR family regulator